MEKALVKYSSSRSKTSLRGRFASRNGISGCNTGYFSEAGDTPDVWPTPIIFAPCGVGPLLLDMSTPLHTSNIRGKGPSPSPPPPKKSYELGDTCAADSHSSVTLPTGAGFRGGNGTSGCERRSSTLGADTVISFVAGDRCGKLDDGEPFGAGVAAVSGPGIRPLVRVAGSFSVAPLVSDCLDRAIRPRFRRSRVNSQWISLRRQREQGNARSHRTRRE